MTYIPALQGPKGLLNGTPYHQFGTPLEGSRYIHSYIRCIVHENSFLDTLRKANKAMENVPFELKMYFLFKNGDIPASHVNLLEGRYMWPSFGANERLFRLQKQLRCQLKMLGDLRNMTVNMSDGQQFILSYFVCFLTFWKLEPNKWMVEPCLFQWEFSMSIAAVKLDEAPVGEQEFGL